MALIQTNELSATGVFAGSGGTVVIEAESATPVGDWETANLDGESTLLWDSNSSNYSTVDASEQLDYYFTVDESGSYYLATHAGRDFSVMNNSDRYEGGDPDAQERTDTGNDAYYGIYDVAAGEYVQVPTKLYTGLGGADQDLRWGTKFDDSSGHYDAVIELEAGKEYRLEIVGRSDAYALDRVVLNKDGFLKDTEIAESSLVDGGSDTPPPVEEPSDDGPSDDGPDTQPPAEESSGDDGGSVFGFISEFFSSIMDFFASLFGGGDDDEETQSAEASSYDAKDTVSLEALLPTSDFDEDQPFEDPEEDDDLEEYLIL
ncbi:MAG: hypothetical protein AAFN59_07275 [Pseudomonadota bacterium]